MATFYIYPATESPNAKFEWNTEFIYKELSGPPNNWSRKKIYNNVISRLGKAEAVATEFDPDSIMLYEYKPAYFVAGTGPPGGTKMSTRLSKRDKEMIAQMYPASPSDIGSFSTLGTCENLAHFFFSFLLFFFLLFFFPSFLLFFPSVMYLTQGRLHIAQPD